MRADQDTAAVRSYYGPEDFQFGDLYLPARTAVGTIVLMHGGFWRAHRGLEMTAVLAGALASADWVVWNLEYRRVGQGAFPATLDDCAAGTDHLDVMAEEFGFSNATVIFVGHSAGGQLAVWTAGRAAARIRADGVLSLGGVLDLRRAAETSVGADAVPEFLGGRPDEQPERYTEADPMGRLPLGVPVRCGHSRADERVPFELSRRYVDAATRSGDDAAIVDLPGTHAEVVDPTTAAWAAAGTALADLHPGMCQEL